MNLIMQMLMQQMGGNAINKIAQQLGLDSGTAAKAVGVALPLLMSALARNSATSDGATSLHKALAQDHSGSILDDIGGFLGQAQSGPGAGILKHILGGNRESVQSQLGQTAGIDSGTMGKVMEMVAPILMGTLGRTTQEQGLDADGLAGFLNGQKEEAQAQEPDILGSLNRMLDADGDGSALDDVGGILGKLFR